MKNNVGRKGIVVAIIILFVGASVIPSTGTVMMKTSTKSTMDRAILYVGGSGPGNYTKIQDAIDAASPGDTIFIYSGTYSGDVVIEKSDLTIIGENYQTTIVTADNTTNYGIFRIGFGTVNLDISELTFRGHKEAGIYIGDSEDITISNCYFHNNDKYGIEADALAYDCLFIDNEFEDNGLWAIGLCDSSCGNIVKNNVMTAGNNHGIRVKGESNGNLITDNIISASGGIGIILEESENNIIEGNDISNCPGHGIRLIGDFNPCTQNIIKQNNISNNGEYGVYVYCSDNQIYHNNFIDNNGGGAQGYDAGSNQWDDDYPSGGNYWSDYSGSDNDGDGIGDTPYPIPGDSNQDNYPLMEPWAGGEIQPFYFVHISDTHIDTEWSAIGATERFIDTLNHIRTFDPPPAFVTISGDLAERGITNNYDEFKDCLYGTPSLLYLDSAETIPIYISPGNHDHRWIGLFPYDLSFDYPGEDNHHCYAKYHDNLNAQIVSIDSGSDDWFNQDEDLYPPEGNGLSQDNIDWLTDILDNNYLKIILIHHPPINYDDGLWDNGVFNYRKGKFLEKCEENHVGLVLSGHAHCARVYTEDCDYNDDLRWGISPDKVDEFGRSYHPTGGGATYEKTLYVQTPAIKETYCYRNISVSGEEIMVYTYEYAYKTSTGVLEWRFGSRFGNDRGSKIAKLHVYDSQGNHIGENESGGVDFQIVGGYYSILKNYTNVTSGMEVSVNFGEDDYIFEIEGLEDGCIDLEFNHYCCEILGDIYTRYLNVSIMNGSVGKLCVNMDSIDHTINMDDDGDGIIDREIEPTIILSPPETPSRPTGKINGKVGVEYTYTTSTTDVNGDKIKNLWDWGDGNFSGWLGPYDSGETAEAGHTWSGKGTYEIKVKAMDTTGRESPWSDSLLVTMPKKQQSNNQQNSQNNQQNGQSISGQKSASPLFFQILEQSMSNI